MSDDARPTVLVVDDEPNLVAALRRVLFHGRRWNVVCAESGAEALEILARQPVTLILSDMRMPGMDGPELLRQVRASYPRVARIVLSGTSDRQSSLQALQVAHRFLTKPTDADELIDAVTRACALRTRFRDMELSDALGAVERLPTPPAVLLKVNALLADPHADLTDIGAALEGDPALAAKILQTVNSAFFGLPQRQSSVSAAVAYLGLATVQAIIAMVSFADATKGRVSAGSIHHYEASALTVAQTTKALLPRSMHADAHAAGLLHDVGWLALAVTRPDLTVDVDAGVSRGGDHGEQLPSHADIGAYLLDLWGLPELVVEAVAEHHGPCAADRSMLAHALQIAVALLHRVPGVPDHPCLDPAHLDATGLGESMGAARAAAELGTVGRR